MVSGLPAEDSPQPTESAFEAGTQRRFDVFLAYNSQDAEARKCLQAIFKTVEGDGKTAWLDKEDSNYGDPSAEAMINGLAASKCCFILQGPGGLGRWQRRCELYQALERYTQDPDFRVFAVLLPGAGERTPELGGFTSVDLTDGFATDDLTDEGRAQLLAAVEGTSLRDFRESRGLVNPHRTPEASKPSRPGRPRGVTGPCSSECQRIPMRG
jgi:hypothetical protein